MLLGDEKIEIQMDKKERIQLNF